MSGAARHRGPDRQHLRQVRLVEPGRQAADGRLPRDARRALGRRPRRSPCSTWAAARACSRVEWAERLGDGRIVGIDLDDPKLRAEWEKRARAEPRVPRRGGHAAVVRATTSSTWPPRSRCSSTCPSPEATLAEMARVARRHLLVSVPREPLWRGLNMARGAYLRDLGNTPGHVNHWSKRGVRLAALALRRRSRRPARRSPGPCCLSAL